MTDCPKCGALAQHHCGMACVDMCPKCDVLRSTQPAAGAGLTAEEVVSLLQGGLSAINEMHSLCDAEWRDHMKRAATIGESIDAYRKRAKAAIDRLAQPQVKGKDAQ